MRSLGRSGSGCCTNYSALGLIEEIGTVKYAGARAFAKYAIMGEPRRRRSGLVRCPARRILFLRPSEFDFLAPEIERRSLLPYIIRVAM
jgi:hypothetical protein